MGQTREQKTATPFSGAYPQTYERGLANGYIRGFNPVLYTFGCSCRVVLHNLQGQKKIAVITRNNDG